MLICSVVSNALWPHGLQLTRLLCPWNFPGENTGVSCHFLLQRIFPTQGLNPCLLLCIAGGFLNNVPPLNLCIVVNSDKYYGEKFSMGRRRTGFSTWLSGKESACQWRRRGFDPWVRKIPWRRKWQPTPVFLPQNPENKGAWRATIHRVVKELYTT